MVNVLTVNGSVSLGHSVADGHLMHGVSLNRESRQLPDYRLRAILILSTESGKDKKQEGRATGVTGCLVKPFNPEQLLATMANFAGLMTVLAFRHG